MTEKVDQDLKASLEKILNAGLGDDCMKAVKKQADSIVYDIQGDLEYRLKDGLAPLLVGWVAEMASRAVEQMMEGNEDQMRRYLSCEKRDIDGRYNVYTGRNDCAYWSRDDAAGHPVIHGKLFEQGAVALRKKIVDAHRDLLVSERILDLEDQVKSLVAQVNKANAEREGIFRRFNK